MTSSMSTARPLMTVTWTSVTSGMTVAVTPGSVRRFFFEYHGWITVRETAVDDDDVRLGQIVDGRDDEDPGYEKEVGVVRLTRGSVMQRSSAGTGRARREARPSTMHEIVEADR
jgi:hypothetical protein